MSFYLCGQIKLNRRRFQFEIFLRIRVKILGSFVTGEVSTDTLIHWKKILIGWYWIGFRKVG